VSSGDRLHATHRRHPTRQGGEAFRPPDPALVAEVEAGALAIEGGALTAMDHVGGAESGDPQTATKSREGHRDAEWQTRPGGGEAQRFGELAEEVPCQVELAVDDVIQAAGRGRALRRRHDGVDEVVHVGERHEVVASSHEADAAFEPFAAETWEVGRVAGAPHHAGAQHRRAHRRSPRADHGLLRRALRGSVRVERTPRDRDVLVPVLPAKAREGDVRAGDVHHAAHAGVAGRREDVLGARDVDPAEGTGRGAFGGHGGGVHHHRAAVCRPGDGVGIADVALDEDGPPIA